MKKRVIIKSMARRIVAVSIIGSMALTGIEMMDSAAFNGTVSGNKMLSGDGLLSGDGSISGDVIDKKQKDLKKFAYNGMNDIEKRVVSKATMEDIVIETGDDVVNYEKNKIKNNIKNVKILKANGYIIDGTLDTVNYEQKYMNTEYEKLTGVTVKGTCAAVASIIVAEFYNYKDYCVVNTKSKRRDKAFWRLHFKEFVDLARKMKIYYNKDGGMYTTQYYKIINPYYKLYKKTMYGHLRTDNYVDNYLEIGKPVIGNFRAPNEIEHAMAIIGTYRVNVKYKVGNLEKMTSSTYFIVNDGWHDCDGGNYRVQYIASKYLIDITTFDYLD